MSKSKVPIIAIVGRANVGKSSLFNRFVGARQAIVADEPGTTRDSIYGRLNLGDRDMWLIDTAGLKKADDDFELTIQEQIVDATEAADIILVVVDAQSQLLDEDRKVARLALRSKKPVILVVNKSDLIQKNQNENIAWERLGITDTVFTSVPQGKGLDELLDLLIERTPKASIKVESDRLKLAILGRPNVGKSQLFNTMAKKQQAIVADRAGTTRDINRTVVKFEGREIELLDTAGIRRSGKQEVGVEKFSVLRSLAAIEESDICVVVMDQAESSVQLDQKIANMVKEAGKGLILIVSKWDLAVSDETDSVDPYLQPKMLGEIARDFQFAPWAPLIFTSAVTGKNISKIFELIIEIDQERKKKIPTPELNNWLEATTSRTEPAGLKNHRPRLLYVSQTDSDSGAPAFAIHGRALEFLHWSYKRHLERTLRDKYDFVGTPVRLLYKSQAAKPKPGK
jgi:GTPase